MQHELHGGQADILRAITSVDRITTDWARIPCDVLEKISNRIINEVKHINKVVYDITSKPPAAIERTNITNFKTAYEFVFFH